MKKSIKVLLICGVIAGGLCLSCIGGIAWVYSIAKAPENINIQVAPACARSCAGLLKFTPVPECSPAALRYPLANLAKLLNPVGPPQLS